MRNLMIAAALVSALALTGCERSAGAAWQASQGSIALSSDDALIYAVDTDNEFVAVVDSQTHKKVAEVKVGAAPEFITVGPDDTIYVANRGGRSVSVIARGEWSEARRLPVGVEPVALVVSADNKVLYVVNGTSLESADYGTLTAIDVASGQPKWDLPVGEEPRGIALLDGGKTAIITLFKKGGVVKVDLTRPEILRDNTAMGMDRKGLVYDSANLSARTGEAPAGTSRFQPRSSGSVVAHPDGDTAYSTVIWAREDAITTRPNSSGGYYARGGPCNLGAVATAGIVTYEGSDLTPQTDDLTGCSFQGFDDDNQFPPSTLVGPANDPTRGSATTQPLQGPVALMVDPTGAWMFVLNRESQNLAVLPTRRRGGDDSNFNTTGTTVRDLVPVGQGANGLAMARDGTRMYVYNQFDHSITVIKSQNEGSTSRVVRAETIRVAEDVLPPTVALGRALFFNALDTRVNNPVTTAVSCNTCHTEGGREDGHVWGFPDGRRQTPVLAGRMMSQTAPFHWTGEFTDMKAFMDHTAVLRMGGQGLGAAERANLEAYMDFAAAPDNPHLRAQPSDAQLRGAQLFAQAQCSTCHLGQARTDNRNYDVGTLRASDKHPTLGRIEALNTPSLLGLARSAPYLHDGSAATLRDRLTNNPGDAHGRTSDLTPAQVDDLVEYLKTL